MAVFEKATEVSAGVASAMTAELGWHAANIALHLRQRKAPPRFVA
jgi:hypothetical protein